MARKTDDGDVAVLDKPVAATRLPKLVTPLGRGSRGKTTLLRWLVERAKSRGGDPVIADFDRTNPTLAVFFPEVVSPDNASDVDVREKLNDLIEGQIDSGRDVFLDLGGGDQLLKSFAIEYGLVEFLTKWNVDPVAIHLLGPDLADLQYLQNMETESNYAPERTILVLNEGIAVGRGDRAFESIMEHHIFRAALKRGARAAFMPLLKVLPKIDAAEVSFATAAKGGATLRRLEAQEVVMWNRRMEENFAAVLEWLP